MRREKIRYTVKKQYENNPNLTFKRQSRAKKANEERAFIKEKDKKFIFDNSWGPDRGNAYLKKIAKKYKVSPSTAKGWTGQDAAMYFGVDYNKLKKKWKEKYNPGWILRSPGRTLLKYYDKLNKERPINQRLLLPPSVIYYYRFTKPNWTRPEVKTKFPKIKPDTLFQMLQNRIKWLNNKDHKEYHFNTMQDMVKWCEKKFGNGGAIRDISNPKNGTLGMSWKGAMAGWSIIRK